MITHPLMDDALKLESDLKQQFKDPPREFSLFPLWAWNDTLEEDELRHQIDEMVEKGIYGAFLHARSGIEDSATPYLSEGWWKAVRTTVEHAARKGFFAILYDEDKWPSGSAGGRVVAAGDEYRKRGIKVDRWELSGPRTINLNSSGSLVAILAARKTGAGSIDPGSVLDLTKHQCNDWPVPEGRWIIMHFHGVVDAGIQIDYLDKEAVRKFIEITHEEYFRRFGNHFGRTIPGIFFDEIYADLEGTDLVWSKNFLNEFRQRKGYDLRPYFLHLFYEAGPKTPKVRCDYFDVFTQLYTEAWFQQIADWCQEHDIWLTGHTLETIRDFHSQGDYFRTWAAVQIPGTDNEDYRYSFPRRVRWYKAKQLSSLTHISGKKRAMVEALGGGGWVVSPYEYKLGLAMLGVYGLNMFVPHLFHYSISKPECMDDWPPSWFYQNPYWKYFRNLSDFGRRIAFMGSQGRHVCDVGLLYPITSLWAAGIRTTEDVGTLGGGETGNLQEIQYNAIQETLLDNLYDYDIVDPEALIGSKITKSQLCIAEEEYSVLILPPLMTIRRKEASKLKAFFDQGGTILVMNTLPLSSMEQGENDGYILNIFKRIFNFDPRALRIGYFETDKNFTSEYVVHTNARGGRAYFLKSARHIPAILDQCLQRDIEVIAGDSSGLRVLHRRAGKTEIYYMVNEQRTERTHTLALRAVGEPEIWNPEDGTTTQITNYSIIDDRMIIPLTFGPWEAIYLIIDPSGRRASGLIVQQTNLEGITVQEPDSGRIKVKGWCPGDQETIHLEVEQPTTGHCRHIEISRERQKLLKPIRLSGEWDFILAPEELDNLWQSNLTRSEVELPVMDFRWEAGRQGVPATEQLADSEWDHAHQIKIKDDHSAAQGCQRYLSDWRGAWINYYRYIRHWGVLGGEVVHFRRKVDIDKEIESGWLCIAADDSYTLRLNRKIVGSGSDWREPQKHDITQFLKRGRNHFRITVNRCQGLLLQCKITFTDGSTTYLISDHHWEASVGGGVWDAVFPYIYPPLGPWGDIPMPTEQVSFPVNLWYRQYLPPGALLVERPHISGPYEVFINDRKVDFPNGLPEADISRYLSGSFDTLTIKVRADKGDEGILEPVKIGCGKGKLPLGSWVDQGLSWYSGRAVYSKDFEIPDRDSNPEIKWLLDLGEVRCCAEIWLNDQLVSYRSWPPFTFNISPYLKPGKNKLSIVVANLLANRRYWDISDQRLTDLRSRFNHEGVVLREKDCLESGLLGPVQIIPFCSETVRITNSNEE